MLLGQGEGPEAALARSSATFCAATPAEKRSLMASYP